MHFWVYTKFLQAEYLVKMSSVLLNLITINIALITFFLFYNFWFHLNSSLFLCFSQTLLLHVFIYSSPFYRSFPKLHQKHHRSQARGGVHCHCRPPINHPEAPWTAQWQTESVILSRPLIIGINNRWIQQAHKGCVGQYNWMLDFRGSIDILLDKVKKC